MESMTEVTSEDLAGVYKDLAETVGVENAYKYIVILKDYS